MALIIIHNIYIYINVGWVLLTEIKMVIWLMNVDDRFCPIFGADEDPYISTDFDVRGTPGFDG